jgi:hypothetical protein
MQQDPAHPYVSNDEFRATGRQPTQHLADLNNPILQPWARDVVRKHNELVLSGKLVPSPTASCWPKGVTAFLLTHDPADVFHSGAEGSGDDIVKL